MAAADLRVAGLRRWPVLRSDGPGLIALLMWGGWSGAEEHTIVVILGCNLGGFVAAMAAVMIGLLVGGPVGRFKGAAGRDGISLEAENDIP
jgi:hypothetical protein